jgi:hypothetical protein
LSIGNIHRIWTAVPQSCPSETSIESGPQFKTT